VRAYDTDGAYVGMALLPWSISIPHEEVTFATDSAAIAPTEAPKLEASYKLITDALVKYRELGAIKLFIAGRTDSVGNAGYNLKLSQRRAQAIAGWFRKRGLKVPVLFEGFGEQALQVPTPDETDEPRNRRVDYFLALDEPPLKTNNFRPVWKRAP
jgi:outer membrane protein OmpA-like peptidoglycan-associated protein